MKYTMVRLFLIAVSCSAISLAGNTANAGWGLLHGGGSSGGAGYGSYGSSGGYAAGYGSSGGYASYGSYSYGSSGGSASYGSSGYGSSGGAAYGSSGGTGPGPLRRFAAHIHDHFHAKHARRAAYGSSGHSAGYGSSGSYVSSYGSSGGYGSSGYSTSYGSSGGYSTSYGSSGGYGAGYGSSGYSTSYGSTGATYGSVGSTYGSGYLGVSKYKAPTSLLASTGEANSEAIHLNVAVPAAAKVYVNDMPTTSVGVTRQFVSRGLEAGKSYKFDVRAELVAADGTVAKETKTVTLIPGESEELRFVSLADTRVQTVVTLNVPEDAKVVLAGNETNATGSTRTYRTGQLKAGEQWDDYVVEVHHQGKIKRETLRLVAGDDIALTFNFDDDKSLVASR